LSFNNHNIPKHDNVILLGAVGVGKTHLAIALAHAACMQGKTVLFTREMARLLKPSLLVIDELGYQQIDKSGADALFQVISQRYERGSTVITSNLAFKQWADIFNHDSTLTSALLDRLHFAGLIETPESASLLPRFAKLDRIEDCG
jgi:DNA replication protein DnaC